MMIDEISRSGSSEQLWGNPPSKWDVESDDRLVCCQVRTETHDVKSFFFRAPNPCLFRYRPGQFVTFEFEIDGVTLNRCYTLSSAPTRPDTISITVKRVPGGKVSNWLHDNVRPGSVIRAVGLSGEFSSTLHPAKKYLYLSGGSGVTPLMSMLRTHYDLGDDPDIVFVHSARTPRDIIFRRELAAMSYGAARLRTAFVCEQVGEERDWSSPTGFLNLPLLRSIVQDLAEREIFCCGPDPYMKAVREMLNAAAFDMTHYHQESFTFGLDAPAEQTAAPAGQDANRADRFKITFTRTGETIECGPDQFILEAARAAGMRLPFSCSQGLCGTCKTKKLSGEVAMTHGGGIRKREIDQGMILVCCSKPLSDVTLEK